MKTIKFICLGIVVNIISHIIIALYNAFDATGPIMTEVMSFNLNWGEVCFYSTVNILFFLVVFKHLKKQQKKETPNTKTSDIKAQLIISASDKFRNTIITELADLYPEGIYHASPGSGVVDILRNKHYAIGAAVSIYRPHVKNKVEFDAAWDNFTGVPAFREKEEKPRYNQYSFTGFNNEFYENPKDMFVENVKQLLKFTKEDQ